jgi:hypothetical protein
MYVFLYVCARVCVCVFREHSFSIPSRVISPVLLFLLRWYSVLFSTGFSFPDLLLSHVYVCVCVCVCVCVVCSPSLFVLLHSR